MSSSIVLVTPYAASIVIFRGPLIQMLSERSMKVYVLAPDYTHQLKVEVKAIGAIPIEYPLNRTGFNLVHDFLSLLALKRVFLQIRPQAVLTFQPKPNAYGILAASMAGVHVRGAMVEGLGFAFTPGKETLKKRLVRGVLKTLYRVSFIFAHKIFFLNPDDLKEFVSMGLVRKEKAVLLGGIGIPLEEWPPAPPHHSPFTFTLIARLLKEKGVREFADAARRVKARHPETCFLLIGPLDTNPGAIAEDEVRGWAEEGLLDWVPWTDDVRPYLRQTSVYVLPSYREGVPRSTQEALAMARPVITTDVPGCRETVVPGVNGFLVPPRHPQALAKAMERFLAEPHLLEQMGMASRKLAKERFDAKRQAKRMLETLGL